MLRMRFQNLKIKKKTSFHETLNVILKKAGDSKRHCLFEP